MSELEPNIVNLSIRPPKKRDNSNEEMFSFARESSALKKRRK